jgi:hypothetical protein
LPHSSAETALMRRVLTRGLSTVVAPAFRPCAAPDGNLKVCAAERANSASSAASAT